MMQIRRAETADEDALASIRRRAILALTVPAMSREQAERWASRGAADRVARAMREHQVWVAVEGAAIGWVEVDRDRVAALYVSPSCSGQGVGSGLLTFAETSIRRSGYTTARLESSQNALDFYLRRGYRRCGPADADGAWPLRKDLAPDPVITRLEQVTPEWLTEVLTRSGALAQGAVAAFDVETGRGNWSTHASVRVRYVEGAEGARPRRLFLKLVDTDPGNGECFDDSEVNYYTRDYVGVAGAPLVRCYAAAFSRSLKRYHLLLEDLSETHVEAATKAPTPEHGLALAEGLAVMHAHWWGAARLAQAGAAWPSAQHIQRFVEIAGAGAGHILEHVSDRLEPHWPETIRTLYARHPAALLARARDAEGFSLIHGDTGATNILVPRAGDRPIYLIDRQPFAWSLTTWLGVYDLAYALVLDWDVETRRRLERPVLQRYHRGLLEHGVSGYSWERLWDDYRLSAAMGVYVATEYCRGGLNLQAQKWWLPKLQRSLTACDDLDCRAQW